MTNGHWDRRRKEEDEAKILYAQGKTQEADYLLGKHLHPDYIPVNERVTEPTPVLEPIVAQTESTSWYWVKYPSGRIEYMKISESLKTIWLEKGYEISRSKIEGVSQEPELIPISAVQVSPTPTPPILSGQIQKIIDDWHNHQLILPSWFANNNINWVISGHITESEFLKGFNDLLHQHLAYYITEPTPEPELTPTPEPIPEPIPEPKTTWWVIRPSGLIEQVTVTQKFIDTMTAQGWIFSKDKPTIEEPQNQNISIVFYIGKGGDLKTHFGINSIVVTPDEAELLAGWLYQNYNTKILFVMNRLTDDVRTHTLQQIKDLIIQKLKDDKPESDDITPDDIKKPQELGIMGAGVGGAIGILILLGFIADSRRKK